MDSFTNDELTFVVRDEGPPDGEPIVLLHGYPLRMSSWDLVIGSLHERGYRTLAYDQRGYSPGARPTRVRDYTVPLIAGDLRALIAAVGRPVHLVGHDWGAWVAWHAAIHFPENLRTLTAFSVPHPAAYLRSLLGRQGLMSWYILLFSVPGLPERMARRPGGIGDQLMASRGGMRPEDLARYRREIIDDGALTGGLNWYRAMPFGAFERPRPVTLPATYVWSDADEAVHRVSAARNHQHCTGPYEYVELPGVSHWIPHHAPESTAEAILARVASVD
ncbi:MAG TPA: alpha/beta fold hydrolase [Solirubrobacteraceae bacterium]|nr:alpha/beta fold hydrolase [Solirubrobacteraceae bacterium]